MDTITSAHEAMAILNDDTVDVLTITTLKGIPVPSASSSETMTIDGSFVAEKQKMVNSCSQTEQERMMLKTSSDDYERRYLPTNFADRNVYKTAKSVSGEKSSGISNAWDNFREKIDMVRGRKHSKERDDNKKKNHRNSSPNTFEQEQDAIAELDSVIDSYHKKANNGVLKRSKRRETEKDEKNGGTWPKARGGPLIQNGTGTILHPRKSKERFPLSVLLHPPKYDNYNYNRISNPIPLTNFSNVNNRHTVYKAVEMPLPSFTKTGQIFSQKSFTPAVQFKDIPIDGSKKPPSTEFETGSAEAGRLTSTLAPSETSIDFSVKSGGAGRDIDSYFTNKRPQKYAPGNSSDTQVTTDTLQHNRAHSQLYTSGIGGSSTSAASSTASGPTPRQQIAAGNFPFPSHHSYAASHLHHPHPHPTQHQNSLSSRYPSPPSLPTALSGESIGLPDARSYCFESPYNPGSSQSTAFGHLHTPSVDLHYHKSRALPLGIPYDAPIYSHGYEGGTLPGRKEDQRIRIPSNTSVTSKSSVGKLSTGSIEKTSERGSPMPTFHVEVLSPGTGSTSGTSSTVRGSNSGNKRASMPDYCFSQTPPAPGELRRVHIDKSVEPLGIQISCLESGGVFVSTVYEHSLASQVGLQIGDQLLEVCGINMRSATYQLAANVLRQCGNSITMLVQYSPDSE
jgi:hypothetical protein